MAVEKVDGVQEAKFSYQRGEGFVTYDPEVTSPDEFIGQLHRLTAYRATLRETPDETNEDPAAEADSVGERDSGNNERDGSD